MTLNEYTVTEIRKIFRIVEEKRFLMLKGATGTGKTLYAHALACMLVGFSEKKEKDLFGESEKKESEKKEEDLFGEMISYCGVDREPYDSVYHNVKIHEKYNECLGKGWVRNVIFHKATNRENFVYGISVSTKENQLRFESRKRVFLEAVEAANKDKGHNYVIILDDIGRADFSAVMGDLLSALESMGDGNTFQADKKREIPKNLYIIATYNPAVAASTVDYAWYRRFFVYELDADERYIIKSKDTVWKNNSIFALYDENNKMRKDFGEFSNFRNMDDYQTFMDYVYVLFLHVKILFEKYSTDLDVRNLYIPGHGMFLTYSKDRSFQENIDVFHLQMHHVIVPLLYHCLHTGLLDQRADFDIDLLEHLWEKEYGKITEAKSNGNYKKIQLEMINIAIRRFPASVVYFFFLRNSLLRRIDKSMMNRYFIFEKTGEHCELHISRTIKISGKSFSKTLNIYNKFNLDMKEPKGENYEETSGQVYPPEVFLTLYKAAVKLLAIAQNKDIATIWIDSDHNLDEIFCRYKNNSNVKNDDFQPTDQQIENGAFRIIELRKAFEGFPEYD